MIRWAFICACAGATATCCPSFPDFPGLVYVADPELIRALFTGDPHTLHAGEANATILEPAVGPRSVVPHDDAHLRERKLLLPAFHGGALEGYRTSDAGRPRARDLGDLAGGACRSRCVRTCSRSRSR